MMNNVRILAVLQNCTKMFISYSVFEVANFILMEILWQLLLQLGFFGGANIVS